MAKTLIYHLYPPAWDGIREMQKHLDKIADLGVDYVRLSVICSSLWCGYGYDVEDHYSIDLRLGSMKDFDNFVESAHKLGIKVIMDLELNHTAISHRWFTERPEFYCRSNKEIPGWTNPLDNRSCWSFDYSDKSFYFHFTHHCQADLNWLVANNMVNDALVQEFRQIVDFWVGVHAVDGFWLNMPQLLNKKFTRLKLKMTDLLYDDKAVQVINQIFPPESSNIFLVADCLDPFSRGELIDFYSKATAISYVSDAGLREMTGMTDCSYDDAFFYGLKDYISIFLLRLRFLLELESYNSARIASVAHMSPRSVIELMFGSDAQVICLYQGQELGLCNPPETILADPTIFDAEAIKKMDRGKTLDEIRLFSAANNRIHLPIDEYDIQVADPDSCYNFTKTWIKKWKK